MTITAGTYDIHQRSEQMILLTGGTSSFEPICSIFDWHTTTLKSIYIHIYVLYNIYQRQKKEKVLITPCAKCYLIERADTHTLLDRYTQHS